jgi:Zn-dependent membrane protease YugP
MLYGYDPYFFLVIPAFIFSLYAQFRVKGTFNAYRKVTNKRGLTGADVARYILDENGLSNISVERVAGSLTDHYDPRTKIVRLSETVYSNTSVSAVGVAAHETGHAIQHATNYGPLALRTNLVPVAGIGSSFGPYLAIFGIMFDADILVKTGLVLFALAVLFYIVTLPVEFNASSRAIKILEKSGMLTVQEIIPAKKVLRAAAMTYVASAAVAMANLARLIILSGRRKD